ncbi:MAG: 3,4-dihydroxy-2-butanone-4-phosphate synthase [Candidatus Nanopelagicaceae bacterium]
MTTEFDAALARFQRGEFLIVVDDHDRENEGDLIMLADHATTEKVAFMVRHTTGILCTAITSQRAQQLRLPYMVERNQDQRQTAFTVSVDLAEGITTGVSAAERAATIRALGSPTSKAKDFVRPGHIFPLIAHNDGLAARQGHTEAGIALAQLAGSYPVALLSEIVAEDGSMARGETLTQFANAHKIPIISIKDIAEHEQNLKKSINSIERTIHAFEWVDIQLTNNKWQIATFPSLKHREQVVLKFGTEGKKPLLRIHSECFTGDVLNSQRCDCGAQLEQAISAIEEYGYGYIVYLRDHEGRGIGLTEKLKAYTLQNSGLDTVDANIELGHPVDLRDWTEAISILHSLHVNQANLLTNNPEKINALKSAGIECTPVPLSVAANEFNQRYLETKVNRLGHIPFNKSGSK